jgi:short-subunit dehydrogenase
MDRRPVGEQVIVIAGASSGIGLATATAAADAGACVVIAARSSGALDDIARELGASGDGDVVAVTCDVRDRAQVEVLARTATDCFGRIDTWVNVAGIGMYGRLEDTPEEDARALFDTNFRGIVNGSLVALPYLRRSGGVLINLGSEVSEAAIPLQGMYVASKHAVKGFNDALRVEVEQVEDASVAVVLIQPTAVDTPFPQHARNLMEVEPTLPSPMIDPGRVASAILAAAVDPSRSAKVGAIAHVDTAIAKLMAALGDRLAARQHDRQRLDAPARHRAGALDQPSEATGVVGQTHGAKEHARSLS